MMNFYINFWSIFLFRFHERWVRADGEFFALKIDGFAVNRWIMASQNDELFMLKFEKHPKKVVWFVLTHSDLRGVNSGQMLFPFLGRFQKSRYRNERNSNNNILKTVSDRSKYVKIIISTESFQVWVLPCSKSIFKSSEKAWKGPKNTLFRILTSINGGYDHETSNTLILKLSRTPWTCSPVLRLWNFAC